MNITIITDGNNTLGMGHVYQSLALINLMQEKHPSLNISIITKSSPEVASILKQSNKPVIICKDDDEIFNYLLSHSQDRILFDKLDVSVELASRIKRELSCKLMIFTNLTDANKYADVTVMAGMGSQFKNLRIKVGNQLQFWGPKYWILRSEFLGKEVKRGINKSTIESVLLIFGGADQANLSTACLSEFKEINTVKKISIVLGASFEHLEEFERMVPLVNKTKEVSIYKNVKNVHELMSTHDLVMASPGLSFFEALLCGTPVLCFHQNKFQFDAWNGLIPTYDKTQVYLLKSLLNEQKFIFPTDQFILDMEIGKGVGEIVNEILIN